MPKGGIIGLLTALGLTAQFANGQLEPDCNPLHTDCQPKKAWPQDNYYIDFTKQTSLPPDWAVANHEAISFTSDGAEFSYAKQGDAPNMWTDFYVLGGRYDVEMKIAPGQGVISSAVLWSDAQDEIDYEFSGNQFGQTPFPPKDGMWAVETNVFAQGKMWDGAATYQKDAYKPTEQFHKYSVDWDETHMSWYVDDKVVRSISAKDTPNGFTFPQSPMKLQLGVWGGGDASNSKLTVEWAGGEIDTKNAPYTMYVRSVNITNKYPACQYKYQDKTGKIDSIQKITDGCQHSNPMKVVKKDPGADDYPMSAPSSAASEAESATVANPPPSSAADASTYEASSPSENKPSTSSGETFETYPANPPPSSHVTSSSADEYPTSKDSPPATSHSSTSEEGYPTSKPEAASTSHSSTSEEAYPTSKPESVSVSHSSSSEEVYPTSGPASASDHSSSSAPEGYPTSHAESSSSATAHSSSLAESHSTYPAASVPAASESSASSVESHSSVASGPVSSPSASQSEKSSATSSAEASASETPSGYPVSSPEISTHSAASSSGNEYPTSSPESSSHAVTSSSGSEYPVSSPTSSRGILSSLSSLLLGTTTSSALAESSSVPGSTVQVLRPSAPAFLRLRKDLALAIRPHLLWSLRQNLVPQA
ncbi:concanavalin A-like lectin/glucanase domain-containing protein [Hypoxylon trugodes]|uniref:concanavalin A-like lectin/glucanase domain-containing protein n=1 Tax=Hypoxylon trugodes TaxID=326681 RepID=UPI00218DF1CB|nr:concanavalin A-like lectin/glucanase domain-containing protein [Hypoxylon trugodes]KAI1384727.1 concanavalin A-like lectin/glucanase domain-containing protein [Hypoxylon trugodes]